MDLPALCTAESAQPEMVLFILIDPNRSIPGIIVIEPFLAYRTGDSFNTLNHAESCFPRALEFSLNLSYNNHAEKHNENPGGWSANFAPGILAFFLFYSMTILSVNYGCDKPVAFRHFGPAYTVTTKLFLQWDEHESY